MTQLEGSGRQPGIGRSAHILRRLSSRGDKGMAGTSRVNREVYARFCGRLEVKSLRPTRRCYLYRAIDTSGALVDVRLSEHATWQLPGHSSGLRQDGHRIMPARVTTEGHDS